MAVAGLHGRELELLRGVFLAASFALVLQQPERLH